MATILAIDDDAHTRRIISMWLSRHGFEVIEASDGAEGLELWQARAPQAVITDINMPVANGVTVAEQIASGGERRVPVIVLTNRCDQADIQEQLHGTGAQLLPKPFSPSVLLHLIQSMLEEELRARAQEAASAP